MNPAEVQAILATNGKQSPTVEGLQRLADWGTAIEKVLACVLADDEDATAFLTQGECLAVVAYLHITGGA